MPTSEISPTTQTRSHTLTKVTFKATVWHFKAKSSRQICLVPSPEREGKTELVAWNHQSVAARGGRARKKRQKRRTSNSEPQTRPQTKHFQQSFWIFLFAREPMELELICCLSICERWKKNRSLEENGPEGGKECNRGMEHCNQLVIRNDEKGIRIGESCVFSSSSSPLELSLSFDISLFFLLHSHFNFPLSLSINVLPFLSLRAMDQEC